MTIPQVLAQELDGYHLHEGIGKAFLFITVDDSGRVRPCMLSPGEILVVTTTAYRLLLWPGSTTSQNLRSGSECVFVYTDHGRAFYLHGSPRHIKDVQQSYAAFEITVHEVREDSHPGMPIIGPIEIEVADPMQLLQEWEQQVAILSPNVHP